MLLFSFSCEAKNGDKLVIKSVLLNECKNKGFAKLLCAFNEIENPNKRQIAITLYVTNFLM